MNIRKILTLATAGTAAASISLFVLGTPAAHALNGVEPVTFQVTANTSLALAQTPSAGTPLVQGTAANMPVTTVTDGRNAFDRTGAWSVTATASDLTATQGGSHTILAAQITLAQSGTFNSGGGTVDATPVGLVSTSDDTVDSVYTYTPTAQLAPQTSPFAGSYSGTVTQTVV
ncbi:MAG: hypothetical protein QOI56_2137 [Actinomycetota bacterium]|jgi:hypothetical protein|nr:hypothetical protein [Actinomycetota bacterium]